LATLREAGATIIRAGGGIIVALHIFSGKLPEFIFAGRGPIPDCRENPFFAYTAKCLFCQIGP
jgi:hypothetical protein